MKIPWIAFAKLLYNTKLSHRLTNPLKNACRWFFVVAYSKHQKKSKANHCCATKIVIVLTSICLRAVLILIYLIFSRAQRSVFFFMLLLFRSYHHYRNEIMRSTHWMAKLHARIVSLKCGNAILWQRKLESTRWWESEMSYYCFESETNGWSKGMKTPFNPDRMLWRKSIKW